METRELRTKLALAYFTGAITVALLGAGAYAVSAWRKTPRQICVAQAHEAAEEAQLMERDYSRGLTASVDTFHDVYVQCRAKYPPPVAKAADPWAKYVDKPAQAPAREDPWADFVQKPQAAAPAR
jgi:hypothetical protein